MNPVLKGRITALQGLSFLASHRLPDQDSFMLRPLFAALLCILSPLTIEAQLSIATNSPNGQPLSQRIVDYTIDARLNTDTKTLDATETLTYRNLTGQPLTTF